jgi:hypothetical protein
LVALIKGVANDFGGDEERQANGLRYPQFFKRINIKKERLFFSKRIEMHHES